MSSAIEAMCKLRTSGEPFKNNKESNKRKEERTCGAKRGATFSANMNLNMN